MFEARILLLGNAFLLLVFSAEAFRHNNYGLSRPSFQPVLFGLKPARRLPTRSNRKRGNIADVNALRISNDDEEESDIQKDKEDSQSPAPTDLTWLRNAMANSDSQPDGLVVLETKPGIAGFSVDPKLGFCAILVGDKDRATYAIVSPQDKQRVQSAEALCLVQLAGGLDLGTPILPPDILAQLVADELEEEDGSFAKELRPRIQLLRVEVDANQQEALNNQQDDDNNESPVVESAPEREAILDSQAPKVTTAVRKLAGLRDCTEDDVRSALQRHADEEGVLDRTAFMTMLETLRKAMQQTEPSKVQFQLVVSVRNKEDEETLVVVPTTSAMYALGLALRYKVNVVLSQECQEEGLDVVEIASRFPAFRPIQELYEDAKIMDGFIPSLFNQATSPPENDDKV